ncbi:MAG: alpha/beta hydrolase [Actinomycetia bacterium]|nr:alpha/beta hydrolase [Actinomycetes bacterium]
MSTRSAAALGGAVGALVGAGESFQPTLVPRSTLHQGLVTALVATTGAVLGSATGALVGAGWSRFRGGSDADLPETAKRASVAASALATAAAGGGLRARAFRRAQVDNYHEWGTTEQKPEVAAGIGLGTAIVVASLGYGIGSFIGGCGTFLSRRLPGGRVGWTLVSATGTAAAFSVFTVAAKRVVFARLAADNDAPDHALTDPPDDAYVSGGPASQISYDTLAREGRRFVNWRISAAEIDAALGADGAVEPVRAFVGIRSADSIEAQVELAVAELESLGGFARSAILIVSPSGSGYANSVPVEALELFRKGDCASVVIQYGLLPSMFSFGVRGAAAESFRLLLDRITQRIATLPADSRPRIFGYGESLGALTAQWGLMHDPALVDEATAQVHELDRALFVGTPGGTSVRNDLDDSADIVHVDRWQALPDPLPRDVQLWFLDHDADPVTRFAKHLLRREPEWLDVAPRGRNVPSQMRWMPLVTWQQVMFDVAYATQSQSGVFRSVGHDYRADLGGLVHAAFAQDSDVPLAVIQQILSEREVARDRLLQQPEQEDPKP